MKALAILLLSLLAAVGYGILHDLATAHVCVEYFTIGHVRVVDSESPLVLALVWGVLATWWVGLLGGVLLAWAARQGPWPKLGAVHLLRPIGICLLVMGAGALLAGVAGHLAASRGWIRLVGPLAERVPPDRHVAFLTDMWAHLASYALGATAFIVLAWRTRRDRRRVALPVD